MRRPVAMVVVLVLALAGCGNDDKPKALPQPVAPAAGGSSSQFGIPLPEGATIEPKETTPDAETYRVPKGISLPDVNAFYEKSVDGKPIRDFTWCGGAAFSSTEIVRIWKKTETVQLRLSIVADPGGVLVRAREDKAAQAQTCPPSPPDLEQPFESGNP